MGGEGKGDLPQALVVKPGVILAPSPDTYTKLTGLGFVALDMARAKARGYVYVIASYSLYIIPVISISIPLFPLPAFAQTKKQHKVRTVSAPRSN